MPTVSDPRDASRVNPDDANELCYWTKRFQVSEAKLRTAVGKVGVIVDDVERELKGTASGGQNAGWHCQAIVSGASEEVSSRGAAMGDVAAIRQPHWPVDEQRETKFPSVTSFPGNAVA